MSEATTAGQAKTGRHQRSARNYLLDRHFQLKYTGYLVGIACFLSVALGLVLWRTSSKVIEQSQRTLEQGKEAVVRGKETVQRGREVIVQSRKVSKVVAMNIAKEYADDPELAKAFQEAADNDEAKLQLEQGALEKDAEFLAARTVELEDQAGEVAAQQRTLLLLLVIVLALLVVGIGLAGIVVTHKVAGPIFKMKRLLREVGEGKLILKERLRKGDELQHFFETFEKMVEDLREKQKAEIAKIDEILERLEEAPRSSRGNREVDDDGVALLKKLRAQMQDQIEA